MIDAEIAAKLGISNGSFYEYQKRYPEFLDAIKRGKVPVWLANGDRRMIFKLIVNHSAVSKVIMRLLYNPIFAQAIF